MTDEERKEEGAEEAIEDLEAPAAAQEDVAGGKIQCKTPTCWDTCTNKSIGGGCKNKRTDIVVQVQ